MPLAAGLRPFQGLSPNRLQLNGSAGGAAAAPAALVAHTAVHSSGATTPAIDTTGSTLLVMAIGYFSNSGVDPLATDSKSNTWTALTKNVFVTDNVAARLFYCAAPTVGSGHTFSSSLSAFQSIAVAAFSGTTVSGVADLNLGGTGTGGTVQPGSGTPAHANEVIVTAVSNGNAGVVFAVNSGFTITDQIACSSGVFEGIGLAYLFQGAAAAVNPAWTGTSLQGAAAMGSWQ